MGMVTITKTARELCEIGSRSAGYSVVVVEGSNRYVLTDLHYGTRRGRRNRGVVLCHCNGQPAAFVSDTELQVED